MLSLRKEEMKKLKPYCTIGLMHAGEWKVKFKGEKNIMRLLRILRELVVLLEKIGRVRTLIPTMTQPNMNPLLIVMNLIGKNNKKGRIRFTKFMVRQSSMRTQYATSIW